LCGLILRQSGNAQPNFNRGLLQGGLRWELMKKNLIIFGVLAVAILLVYSNTFKAGLHYDDSVNITHNSIIQIKSLDWESIKATWFAGGARGDIYHPVLYRPLAMCSFALNYYFNGLDVFWYHAVNTLIHIITAMLLFLFIKEVLLLPALREKYGDYALQIAGLAAFLWAINPVQLTSVTYIVQRQNSLCGMFYLLAFYFYIRARKSKSPLQYTFSGLAIVLAMLSKENAILAFPAIALFEVMFFGMSRKKLTIFGCFIIGGFLLILAVQGWETFSIDTLMKGYAKREFTVGQRVLTESRVMVFYIMLLLCPYHGFLCLTHVVPLSHGLLNPPATLVSLLIIATIFTLAIIKIKKHPLICYCVFFFFLNHLVEGTVIPLELIYEHRNYIPSFFFFLPIAILVIHAYRHWFKSMALVTTALIVLFMGYNTYIQNKVWETDYKLWVDVCTKSPDPRSIFNFAGVWYTFWAKGNAGDEGLHKAIGLWMIAATFNERYGTDYSEDPDVIPYGRVMSMARYNAQMLMRMSKMKRTEAIALRGLPEDRSQPNG